MEIVHSDNVDAATRARWEAICHETTLAMQDHCLRYVAPISRVITNDEAELQGTAAYIEFRGKRLLITNEHVLRNWKRQMFGHQFHGCEDVFKLRKLLALEEHPVDTAICIIADKIWESRPHSAEAVPVALFAERHQPAVGELFFLTGYPEQRSRFLYGNLISRATRLVTQEPPDTAELHPNYFALAYAPEKAQSVDPQNAVPLSIPHGLSGSLVWNTRRVECDILKREWTPELAQVTGMLCRWDSPTSTVSAIRVEVILDFLRRRTSRPYWVGRFNAFVARRARKLFASTK